MTDALVDLLTRMPTFIAGPIIEGVSTFSHQGHKCSSCGAFEQIPVRDLIAQPTRVLSEEGRKKIAQIAPDVFVQHPLKNELVPNPGGAILALQQNSNGSSSSSSSISSPNQQHQPKHQPREQKQRQEPSQPGASNIFRFFDSRQMVRRGRFVPLVFSAASPFTSDASFSSSSSRWWLGGGVASGSAYSFNSSSSSRSRVQQEQQQQQSSAVAVRRSFHEIDFSSDHFSCKHCDGRLGIHCYEGDATGGNRQKLCDRLVQILSSTGLVAHAVPGTMSQMNKDDIFFV